MAPTLWWLLLSSLLISHHPYCASAATRQKDGGGGGGDLWCVAKNNAEDAALQSALDWACGPGQADCGPIQQGGDCFEPNDVQDHASYAFNSYFLHHGSASEACDFSGTAALTSLNPSQNSCTFPSSSSAQNGSFSGTGPVGADLNGADPVRRPDTWKQISTVALLLTVVVACGGGI